MHLYNLSISSPSTVTASAIGSFSGTRQQEIVICRGGTRLELLRPNTGETGKAESVFEQDTFGVIRSLAAFRLTGGTKDYLIIGSDSGRITIAELDTKVSAFSVVHQETFGRSGSRRIVPGQYLAVDAKGRAVMIGSVEKSKLVYILNRDAAANLTISSPLEAHKANGIIHALVGLDVGYENPTFAALEVDYEDADRDPSGEAALATEKLLTYYELDLGLNHVVRRWSSPVDPRSSYLIQVPGGYNQVTERFDGPGGVLVCSEDYITWKHSIGDEHRVPIPRRQNPVESRDERSRGSIITTSVCHRMKNDFFFLVQNEDGDLFKITIDHEGEDLHALNIKYFDTVPLATSLHIIKAGFLFVAAEAGSSVLYSFQKTGDDDDLPTYSSSSYPANGMTELPPEPPRFTPRSLDNLILTDTIQALDPIIDSRVFNAMGSDTPQIFTASGRGPRSSFQMLQHGLEVHEATNSGLPGIPNAIWTTRLRSTDEYDSYIILSFVNGTLVLSIGESIEEVSDSGFLTSEPTLAVQQLGAEALLQVHPRGIRHIMADRRVVEWAAPTLSNGQPTTIVAATTNERQVVVALEPTNELVYFEQDLDGQLNEYQERKPMGARVVTMSMAEPPPGRQRTSYLAVGCEDQTVRIVSLDPEMTLSSVSIQALTAQPHSICVAEMEDATVDRNHPTMFVNIGLKNGVLLRTVLDPISGQLTDTRTRFLGAKPVRLVRVKLQGGEPAVLALSTKPWLYYCYQSRTHFTPLIYDALDHAWTFSAELCPEGLIGIVGGSLRILTIPTLGTKMKSERVPLSYTPRKIAHHPSENGLFYIVEADHRTLSPWEREKRIAAMAKEPKPKDRGVLDLDPAEFGPVRAGPGKWSSCVRVVDAVGSSTTQRIELEGNEAAFSVAIVPFASGSVGTTAPVNGANGAAGANGNGVDDSAELYLVVGSAVEMHVSPRSLKTAYLTTYRISPDGRSLTLVHKTEVEDVPTALRPFQGRLLAGIGHTLRIYDLGKKKLLRKCENRGFPTVITSLHSQGSRIIVGDMQESTIFVTYKTTPESRLIIFADDVQPRWTTALTMLDYDTVAGGDKFGNLFVTRLSSSVSQTVDADASGLTISNEKPLLQGAPHKVSLVAHFHLGDIITSVHRTTLVPGGRPVILYTCLGGTIGVAIPLVSKEDIETLTTLQTSLSSPPPLTSTSSSNPAPSINSSLSLVGRDHSAHRSTYVPLKAVVDGDLCEKFTDPVSMAVLGPERRRGVAEVLDRTVGDVAKKLEAMRQSSAW